MPTRHLLQRHLVQGTLALGMLGSAVFGLTGTAYAVTPINYWSSACPTQNLHEGEGDGCVAYLQEQLNKSQVTPTVAVDGSFGPKTEAAVIAFQQYVDDNYTGLPYPSLSVDGVAGPQTRTDLDTWDSHVGQ
ncbi:MULTISPECIES: peptidoglycan-binding protein [Streptacidiphilus]|uniref:Peptidoglycan-binding protein n=1 Tax=Streptacidiphilus cavernicola TaxID=3342716 RepID=A0ABV6UPJ3_9ACTN|nr:peptidoglycan-binding protein [Streptacidiphilus jeojiense]